MKKLLFLTLLTIFLIPIVELGSFISLQLYQLINFKMSSKFDNKFIPDQFLEMKLGEFPYVATHYDYKDGNYSSSHGFRGGQSDVVISLNEYFYYEIKGKKT